MNGYLRDADEIPVGFDEDVFFRSEQANVPLRFRSAHAHAEVSGALPELVREYVKTWSHRDPKSMLLIGGTGIGKTHFACATINELLRVWGKHRGVDAYFFNVNTDLPRLLDSRFFRRYDPYASSMRKLETSDILVVDDLLHTPETEWAKDVIYRIYEARYSAALPTITTLNANIVFGDDEQPDWAPISAAFNEPFMRRLVETSSHFTYIG